MATEHYHPTQRGGVIDPAVRYSTAHPAQQVARVLQPRGWDAKRTYEDSKPCYCEAR